MTRRIRYKMMAVSFCVIMSLALSLTLQSQASSLSEAQKEKEALEESLAEATALVNELKDSKASTQEKVDQLNEQLDGLSAKVDTLEAQLEDMNTKIADSETSLAEARVNEAEQYENMKKRIQYTYENGNTAYLDAIFSAKNMSSFINAVEYASMMTSYDRQMLEQYQDNQTYIAETQANLEEEYIQVEQMQAQIEQQQEAVALLASAKEDELGGITEDLSDAQALEKAYQQEVQAQNEVLAQIQTAIEAENQQNNSENTGTTEEGSGDSGSTGGSSNTVSASGFQWPCPAYTRISSDYGPRPSPTAGASTVHKGVDLAAPYGSNILAAQSGTVIIARYSSSAGNYVTINHGKDADGRVLCTTYMHASSLNVSVGQTVTKGQVIAKVGSTGYSTGNHLHFGVSLDGSYVSPWNYISKP